MRLVIVEDEPLAREKLAAFLTAAAPDAEIVAKLGSVSEAVAWFQSNAAPDLLFCDILLSDGMSFEIFRAAPVPCPVVFTTAFDEYLLEAFQSNGIDYLLKPIRQSQVAAALGKYRALAEHFAADYQTRLRNVTHHNAKRRDRFLVRKGVGYHVIRTGEIAYFHAEDKLVFLMTRSGQRYLVDMPLAAIEAELERGEFFRANRAWLVHVDAVERLAPCGKGKLMLELTPSTREPVVVSQERAAACRSWLGA
ncbi:MAG: response regulator transcription factor [Acidobacteria bacterium]|nr:response regulator transcription factor [Acidobacteriota bacterium]